MPYQNSRVQPTPKPEHTYPIEIETHFIAQLIANPQLIETALLSIDSPKYFLTPQAKSDYKTLIDMHNDGEDITPFSFAQKPNTLRSTDYVMSLADATIKTEYGNQGMHQDNIHQWCDLIIKAYINRLAEDMKTDKITLQYFLSEAENITEGRGKVSTVQNQIDELLSAPDNIKSVFKYPFVKIQNATNGIYPGHLIVVAARTGIGKTIFLQNMALEVGKENQILFVSTEMNSNDMLTRTISNLSLVNIRFEPNPKDLPEYHQAINEYSQYHIDFMYTTDMREILKAIKSKKYKFVFIDYLQMLTPMGRYENSFDKVAQSVIQIKKFICIKEQIPVMVAAQFNREGAKAGDKPELHQLKDSGLIEQTADYVISLYQTEDDRHANQLGNEKLHYEILKSRHGQAMFNTKTQDNYLWVKKPIYKLIDNAF